MQFLSCSSEKLTDQLNDDQIIHLKAAYPAEEDLLTELGIYCYDYMNSMEQFDETSLPHKEHFFIK